MQEMPLDIPSDTDTAIIHFGTNEISNMNKSIQEDIERCFRHIAIGRRNWLHTGSHQSAKNIAFMFGLLETCLPCCYVPRYKEGQDAA